MSREHVAVVVVTWNSAATIGDCLRSVPADMTVVVIDNASTDRTAAEVATARPTALLRVNESNQGFAAAANQGMAELPGADVLLLNPDATLAQGAVEALARFADGKPRAGAVSALVVDEEGRPERYASGREPTLASVAVDAVGAGRIATRWSLYQPGSASVPTKTDWVAGTAVLLRREAICDVGPFDESYFLYCEDIDLCRRLREHGWEIWICPAAVATHRRSSSVNRAGHWVDAHRIGSIDRYFGRQHSRPATAAFRAVRAMGSGARAAAWWMVALVSRDDHARVRARQRRRDALLSLRGGGRP